MLPHTVSPVELLWTIVNIFGVCSQYFVLAMTSADVLAIENHPTFVRNGLRHVQAKGRRRAERIKTVIMLGFVLIGGVTMTLEPANGDQFNRGSVTLATVFILTAILMIVDTWLYIRDRKYIFHLLRTGQDYR